VGDSEGSLDGLMLLGLLVGAAEGLDGLKVKGRLVGSLAYDIGYSMIVIELVRWIKIMGRNVATGRSYIV
jgi:hypothetical protein